MEFYSRRRSQDLYSGKHRSTQMGGCTEFADHRPYYPGDPLRQMDWRLAAKRDRHYIKRYEDERTVSTLILIDRSGSMGFELSTHSKYLHALRAAACLTRLLLANRDPVGLASWNQDGDGLIVKPRSTPSHFEALFESVAALPPEGDTYLARLVDHILPLFPSRMRILLFTDGFMDFSKLIAMVQKLTVKGHEVILGQVLAPEELHFEFEDSRRFVDMETGHSDDYLDIDPAVYREAYLKEFNRFLENTVEICAHHGCGYVRLRTDQPAGAGLAAFLRRWNSGSIAPVLEADVK